MTIHRISVMRDQNFCKISVESLPGSKCAFEDIVLTTEEYFNVKDQLDNIFSLAKSIMKSTGRI